MFDIPNSSYKADERFSRQSRRSHSVCVMSVCALLLVCVPLSVSMATLDRVNLRAEHGLTCGQGLVHCEVESGAGLCLCGDGVVDVSGLDASLKQCWKQERWSLCLNVLLNITVRDTGESSSDDEEERFDAEREYPHEDGDKMTTASICVCYTYSSPQRLYKTIRFTFNSSALDDSRTLKTWMTLVVDIPEIKLGSSVVVHSSATKASKEIPSKDEVCSTSSDAVHCVYCDVKDSPMLGWRTDPVTGAVVLYVVDAQKWRFQEFSVCQKLERSGSCLKVEWNNTSHEFEISPSSVAPCLCFKIWGNFTAKEYCPFLNETAVYGSSLKVSLSEAPTHQRRSALLWNITAPCRLEAQLSLCVKDSPDDGCRTLNDQPHLQIRWNDSWFQTERRHWRLQGEFLHMKRHPSLCVQVKVSRMDVNQDPVCPFEVRRKHWSFPLVLCVLLVCLSVLGVYTVQGTLKSWVFRWLKLTDVNPAVVGGLQLLLLSPPDGSASQLLCSLSSCLSSLGFSVSLDLWSCSEISSLGPVPWLHSGLERVRRSGGRAVLVVTQASCERAQYWSCGAVRREENQVLLSSSSEVFDASLSLILADYLLSRTTERFLLVQFDDRRPAAALPDFFQGLPIFSLPSQSLDFVTELTQGAHPGRRGPERWERAGALRAASRALSGALRESTPPYRLTGTLQDTKPRRAGQKVEAP